MSAFKKPPIREQYADYGKEPPASPAKPLSVASLGAYRARSVKWLWKDWLPIGEVVVGEGMGGVSKSTFLTDIIARLTTLREMPDGQPHPTGEPIEALWITNEDDPDTQLKPRLVAAHGDPEKTFFVSEDFTLPDDGDRLSEYLRGHPTVGIVVIDPLFSHMDDAINTGSDTEMRQRVMKPLKNIARECGVVIVVVRHFNKNTGQEVALRGSGSYGGISGAARVVITVLTDPDDDTKQRRLIGPTKSNYARLPMPLAFTVNSVRVSIPGDAYEDDLPVVEWHGVSEIDLDEAMSRWQASGRGGKARKERENAADVDLRDTLHGGPVPAKDVFGQMGRRGYGKDATNDAAGRLGVIKKKKGMEGGWWWWLPGDGPKDGPSYRPASSSDPSASSAISPLLVFAEGAEEAEDGFPYMESISSAVDEAGGRITGTDGLRLLAPPPQPNDTNQIYCSDYHAHQFSHRFMNGRWVCTICTAAMSGWGGVADRA